jgi:hypothetical protein
MSRWQSWSSHIATLAVGITGIVYLIMKYFMKTDDPFAIVNHPLQPLMLDIHLLAAPLLVFLFGLMFESHIQRKLRAGNRMNRKSGLIAAITFGVMTLSGYVLQLTAGEVVSRAALGTHLISSGLFLVSYLVHQVINFRLWRARIRQQSEQFVYEA